MSSNDRQDNEEVLNTETKEATNMYTTVRNEPAKRPRSVYRPSSRDNFYKKS